MNSKAAEEAYARGIFNAFLAYRKKHDGNITIPFQVEPEEKEIVIPQIVPQNEVKEEPVKEKKAKEKKEEPVKVETIVVPESPEGLEQIDLSPVQEVSQSAQPAPTPVPEATPQPQQEQPQQPEPVKVAPKPAGPVFKVQIFASSVKLKANDARFKKHKDAVFYQEGGMYKYTIGASEDYNAINRLRKELLADFPEAFIIAFKDGSRMNVVEAIKEFKSKK